MKLKDNFIFLILALLLCGKAAVVELSTSGEDIKLHAKLTG
jgi:hypothetical protein